jgi:hypothetical protein
MKKNYVAGLSKSGEKKQKASIGKGKKAYKKGEKLSKDYFDDRKAIGGPSLEEGEEEKEPGAISGSTTADDVIKRKKINLGNQGEAGTGVVTIPKGTDKQQLDYEVAVRRRMNPDVYDKLDALKRDAKPSYNFGSNRKPGAGIVYEGPNYEEEGAGKAKYRKFLEEVTSEDGDDTASQSVDEAEDTGDAFAEGDISYEDWVADTGLPPLKPGQKVVQSMWNGRIISQIIDPVKTSQPEDPITVAADVYKPYAHEGVDTSDEYQREEFGLDASEQQYDDGYMDQDPVKTSRVKVDGKEYQKEVYDDGAVFYVTDDGDVMRQENRTGL